MSAKKMHRLLKRQLKRSFGESFEVPDEWSGFVDMVNSAYHESDIDRNMLERSLELSSQELLQANSGMRAIFEAVPDVFFRIDDSGKILDCKTGNTSDLFLPRQDMIGNKIYDIPLAPVAGIFREALEDMRRTGAPVSFEYSFPLRGTESFYEARLIPLLEDQAIIIIRNITNRKDAENALKKSEEYFREITMNSSDVLFIVNEDETITYVSPSVERFTGYRPDELIGKNGLDMIHPDDTDRVRENFNKALATREISVPNSFRIRHKNGNELIMEGTGKNLLHNPAIAGLVMNIRDVTDRKRAEEALRETEKRFRLITDNVRDAVWLMDMKLRTTWISPSVELTRGFTLAELKNLPLERHLTPESLRIAAGLIEKNLSPKRLANSGEDISEKAELEFYRKDGSTMWADTVITLLRDGQGQPTGFLGLSRDTTERRKMEEALRESEQRYRLLASYYEQLNVISIAFAEASGTEGLFNRIAQSFRRLTGAIAATFSVYHPQTRSLRLAALSIDPVSDEKVSPFFGPELFEMHMPVGEGDLVYMLEECVKRPRDLHELSFGMVSRELSDTVMDAFGCRQIIALALSYSGNLFGACAAYLTENQPIVPDDALRTFAYLSGMAINRKTSEQTIRDSEERYRTIFESTATANIIIAEDTTIRMANNNFASLCGYTKQELEGKMSWTVFIHKDDLEKMKTYHHLRRIEHRSAPSSYEFRLINRQGEVREIFINVAIIPETKESIASLIDLTERKQLETQLIQAQKMESVGRLAGGVAHDFNNMLSVIIGNTEMAMNRVGRTEPLYHSMQEILNAGMRSAELTRQLLAFARKQTVDPKVMDLNDKVAGMLKMLQRLIGENIDLGWCPGHNLWPVKLDPSQVDQLLANLTVNARDAIEKAGRITIETFNIIRDETYCADRPEWVPGKYVVLAVSDNGCGMEKETMANVFEPFFTTKKDGQGTGLGLATVYGIVKQNNGFINVYSEPGIGTTFKIYLPRHDDEAGEPAEDGPEAALLGGTETILIAEDEEAVLKLSVAMLEALGYKVLAAKNKDQALDLAGRYCENIDLLLTDVVMPGMNGKELAERILAVKPSVKCVYMSGYTADVIARQGVLEEGVKFISKPFSLRDLAAKVREALGP